MEKLHAQGQEGLKLLHLPDVLMGTNKSSLAQERRESFKEAKNNGEIVVAEACSDARNAALTANININRITSIAVAEKPKLYRPLYNHPGTGLIIIGTHIDGRFPFNGEVGPKGCGGQMAKEVEEEIKKGKEELNGLKRYIVEDIETSDPILQAQKKAKMVADTTVGKPVFMSVTDHISGNEYIFGVYFNDGQKVQCFSGIDFEKYSAAQVYASGILPELNLDITDMPTKIGDAFVKLKRDNRGQVEALNRRNPNFSKNQEIQNPFLVYIGSSPRSLRVAYPGYFEDPNKVFSIRIAKEKQGREVVRVHHPIAFDQIEYVIGHANAAHNSLSQRDPFRDTMQILIETENSYMSIGIAHQMCDLPFMQTWLKNGGEIYTSEIKSGHTNKIQLFTPQKR